MTRELQYITKQSLAAIFRGVKILRDVDNKTATAKYKSNSVFQILPGLLPQCGLIPRTYSKNYSIPYLTAFLLQK